MPLIYYLHPILLVTKIYSLILITAFSHFTLAHEIQTDPRLQQLS
jgi:hypothetical protein